MPKGDRGGKRSKNKPITADTLQVPSGINKRQEQVIKNILNRIPSFDFYNPTDYEIKELNINVDKIDDKRNLASVVIVTGRKNDENTAGAILNRKHRQFFLGKNGGISVLVKNKDNKYVTKKISEFDLLNKYYEH